MRRKYRIKIVDSYGIEQYIERGNFTRKGKQKDNTYIPFYKDFGDEGKQVEEIEDRVGTDLLLDKIKAKRQRQVVEMRMDKIPYKEIAKTMKIAIQTAKNYRQIAKNKMKKWYR